jgi:hypothetical protein
MVIPAIVAPRIGLGGSVYLSVFQTIFRTGSAVNLIGRGGEDLCCMAATRIRIPSVAARKAISILENCGFAVTLTNESALIPK